MQDIEMQEIKNQNDIQINLETNLNDIETLTPTSTEKKLELKTLNLNVSTATLVSDISSIALFKLDSLLNQSAPPPNLSPDALINDTQDAQIVATGDDMIMSDDIDLTANMTIPSSSDNAAAAEDGAKIPFFQDISQVTLEGESSSCEEQVSSASVLISADVEQSTMVKHTTDPIAILPKSQDDDPSSSSSLRHGISRYAPYGTRFAALMKDGSYKMSHIAGDLANRARSKTGKGGRADLVLVTHEGEREQLDAALAFYENANNKYAFGPKPGPSEVLNHLKDMGIDWDYRKGDNVKLLQRNASNFFKRMMEHARRLQHPLAETYSVPPAPANATMVINPTPAIAPAVETDVRKAAAILTSMMFAKLETEEYGAADEFGDEMDIDHSSAYSPQSNYALQSMTSSSSMSISQSSSTAVRKSHDMDMDRVTDWSRPKHLPGSFYYEVCRHTAQSLQEENEFYSKAAENFDWSLVEDVTSAYKPNRVVQPAPLKMKRSYQYGYESDSDFEEFRAPQPRSIPKKQKVVSDRSYEKTFTTPARHRQPPKAFVSNGSVVSTAPQAVIRKGREGLSAGVFLKGLSRHSPYGTRFCATMPGGEKRESYLAGDLADRVRSGPGGSELLLVLHQGEIEQLQSAWSFVQSNPEVGAGHVLDHLRSVGRDANHRKPGTVLLQKNAGNFFKRVQEYGKRKGCDPNYLSFHPIVDQESVVDSASTVAPVELVL